MAKILELRAENVKRLKVVELVLGDGVTPIAGRNGQGKTSVLDAVEMAFGGKSSIPRKPVRTGETKASIVVKLDNGLVVTRHIKPDGTGTLKVQNGDGATFSSPQAQLDALVGSLSFDPLAFSRMKATEQYETLRRLMGIDTSAIEAAHKKAFDSRTDVNREVKRLEGELSGIIRHEDAPAAVVGIVDLTTELEAARAYEQSIVDLDAEAERAKCVVEQGRRTYSATQARIKSRHEQIVTLREQITKLEKGITDDEAELATIKADGEAKVIFADTLAARAKELRATAPDTKGIRRRIENVEDINALVRQNARHAEVSAKLAERKAESDALTERLASLDAEKAALIEAAPVPMPGLALADGEVLLNGLPFDQGSGAEQLRASVAIGIALNPKLRVLLVRDGSLLDRDGLRLLGDIAAQHDCQVLLERVDTTDGVGIVIEDGSVVGATEVSDAAE